MNTTMQLIGLKVKTNLKAGLVRKPIGNHNQTKAS